MEHGFEKESSGTEGRNKRFCYHWTDAAGEAAMIDPPVGQQPFFSG